MGTDTIFYESIKLLTKKLQVISTVTFFSISVVLSVLKQEAGILEW